MKKVVSLILAAVMILTLAACGGGASTAPASDNSAAAEDSGKQEETSSEGTAADSPTADSTTSAEGETGTETTEPAEPQHVVVGVLGMSQFNKTIWETIANKVKDEGVELEIREFSEPNYYGLRDKDFDICTGLSRQFLAEAESGSDNRYSDLQDTVMPVGYTTVTPYNLYSWKYESIDDLAEGDSVIIDLAIDGGGFSSKRSALVLEAAGLITINDASEMPEGYSGYNVIHYIKENLKGITFETMPHEAIDINKENTGAVLSPRKEDGTLIFEDPALHEEDMWTPLWISADKADDKAFMGAIEKIVDAYHSQEVLELYQSSGSPEVPVGWDVDLIP